MALTFLGKWSFSQGSSVIRIDPASGALSAASIAPTDGSDRFNAYGTAAGFVLQGANGLYVVAVGTGYAATKTATDPLNQFTLFSASGGVAVLDLGIDGTGATQVLWNVAGTTLGQVAKSDPPPAGAILTQTIVTPGIATIITNGFGTPQPDLSWVNIAGTDFGNSNIDFTQTTLTDASLANCIFATGTAFENSTGAGCDFGGATLNGCSLGSCTFTKADFTNAKLRGASADGSDFTGATMNGVDFTQSVNLAGTKFIGAQLRQALFTGSSNIVDTDFTGAQLQGAVFTGSSVTGTMTLTGADLTGAKLDNPRDHITIYPGFLVLDRTTNCTRAKLTYLDFGKYRFGGMVFTQADLTGCNLAGADLTGADLSFAMLDGCTLTGTVKLNGANLSNASLRGADLSNAQMGALSGLFNVTDPTEYAAFLAALKSGDVAGVKTVFAAHNTPLTGTVTIAASKFADGTWSVEQSAPPIVYTVLQQTIGGVATLGVYQPTAPAVLSNAFMVGVKLTSANMIGVNASGASIYGTGGVTPNLNSALLQQAQFANANLGNADFSSANLAGCVFDYAILTNAVFQNTTLTTAAGGARVSFSGANLQGASFDGATLANVVFTNAAFGSASATAPGTSNGVWLFDLAQLQMTLVEAEMTAAALTRPPGNPAQQFTLTLQALQQLQAPGPVGKGIVSGFKSAGITLTADAVLSIVNESIYWQVTDGTTHYVVFQTYDSANYLPALGVAAGTDYTTVPQFYLPLALQSELNNGLADAAVVAAFQAAGHPISASAQIVVAQHPTDWQVINGAPDYAVYSLWFDLSGGQTRITVRPAIPNTIAAFYDNSVALGSRATVTPIAGGGWMVSNDAEDPFNPVKNYIIYNLVPNATTGMLDVFGSFMRIQRLMTPTQTEYFNIPAAVTRLTQTQMSAPGNVCPNGEFATTNTRNALPYDQWLRARVTPRPPLCVPDPAGMYVCPR